MQLMATKARCTRRDIPRKWRQIWRWGMTAVVSMCFAVIWMRILVVMSASIWDVRWYVNAL